ncbi:hypothetical protein N7516_000601 [Penicillium verrucosum]|uniref:uncharacterized protein n=1 Tax=Penicillium verrucosum TaxID=60171 RepID=UPI002545211E|nr:uncharacterized protein N7516_000601 [Penicillium verrucosum]KAJ5940433.1 hypothetical protein N7516_000601 [Penicillium verrucosum]
MQSHGPLPRVASPALNPGIPKRRKISLLDLYSAFTQASTSPSFCTVAVMPHYDLHWFDMICLVHKAPLVRGDTSLFIQIGITRGRMYPWFLWFLWPAAYVGDTG